MNVQKQKWDFVIVGTGISGGTIGYALARAGKKVLFIEKGPSLLKGASSFIKGEFPEAQIKIKNSDLDEHIPQLKAALRCTQKIVDMTDTKNPVEFIPLLGEGTGGSSAIYGAAFERFFPEDFKSEKYHSQFTGHNTVDWPISYDDLEPYYDQAEKLYKVYGGVDPIRSPYQSKSLRTARLSPAGEILSSHWKLKGLHPYRLPVAHPPHDESDCPGCQAVLCSTSDKQGSYEACLKEAIEKYGAVCLDSCEVTRLEVKDGKISEVHCFDHEQKYTLTAEHVILAAGALFTPALLLKSKSGAFENGLANNSGMVGRNLCRHYLDLAMVKLSPFVRGGYYEKELALNDFYFKNNLKLGTVQSLGNPPHFNSAWFEMKSEKKSRQFFQKIYLTLMKWVGRPIYNYIMKNQLCLAVIMEDLSYADNRITVDSDGRICLSYKMQPEAFQRLKVFHQAIKKSLRPYRVTFHSQAENNQRLAHASGTCRMGLDPSQSVVNAQCRSHDIDNLYIIDSSIFPSSAGINPSLTLAANALRVADIILNTHQK